MKRHALKIYYVFYLLAALFLAAILFLLAQPSCAFAATTKYEPSSEDIALAKSDPSCENSYRYFNGALLDPAYISTSASNSMSLFKVVTSGGYKYFDTFDTYKKGYCTGVGAYKGIDVAEHQGSINWAKVKKAGVDFAIIRCGYGSNVKSQDDDYWAANVKGCVQNGIPFGVYIYSYATSTSKAKSEANHVLRCLNSAGLGPSDLAYPIYFDMEDSSAEGLSNSTLAKMAKTFCNAIADAGYTVGVYANTSWWTNKLTSSTFDNYHKWCAEYNTSSGLTYEGLSNFSSGNGIWQFSSMGKVSGINDNNVDLNYTYMAPNSVELVEDLYTQPQTPYAKTVEDGEYIIYSQVKTTMVATVKNGSSANNANIHIGTSDMTTKQRFKFTRDDTTGFYTITNSASGKVFGLTKSGTVYLSNLAQHTLDASDNSQKWIVTKSGTSKYIIKNAANPNYVMRLTNTAATNGSNIQVGAWKNVAAQKWGLVSTSVSVPKSTASIKTGIYTLALSKKTSRVLEVTNGSSSKGANIRLYTADKSAKQKFRIASDGDGYYHITSLISGKAIEAQIGNLVPKTNVQLGTYKKSALRQKWSVSKSGGKYVFTCAANGQVLEVASGSTKAKANIQTNFSGATTSQTFVLKTTKAKKTVKNGTHSIALVKDKSKGIAIKSNSKKSGVKARLVNRSSSKSSKFVFKYDSKTGFYTIKNKRSGKYLEIAGTKCTSGKSVRQAKKSSSYAQRWIVTKVAKGKYVIKSALNPEYVLDAGKKTIKTNSTIKIYKRNSKRIQAWKL